MQHLGIHILGQNTFFWVRLTRVRQMRAAFLQKLSQLSNPDVLRKNAKQSKRAEWLKGPMS